MTQGMPGRRQAPASILLAGENWPDIQRFRSVFPRACAVHEPRIRRTPKSTCTPGVHPRRGFCVATEHRTRLQHPPPASATLTPSVKAVRLPQPVADNTTAQVCRRAPIHRFGSTSEFRCFARRCSRFMGDHDLVAARFGNRVLEAFCAIEVRLRGRLGLCRRCERMVHQDHQIRRTPGQRQHWPPTSTSSWSRKTTSSTVSQSVMDATEGSTQQLLRNWVRVSTASGGPTPAGAAKATDLKRWRGPARGGSNAPLSHLPRPVHRVRKCDARRNIEGRPRAKVRRGRPTLQQVMPVMPGRWTARVAPPRRKRRAATPPAGPASGRFLPEPER